MVPRIEARARSTDGDYQTVPHSPTPRSSGVYTETNELARNVASLLEKNLAAKAKAGKSVLAGLDKVAWRFLEKNPFATGAGTFVAAEAVEEGGRPFEWWYRKSSGEKERLDADRMPGSQRYYDYEKLPFFTTAASTGEQTLSGPYLDYLGFEEYILSFTAPIFVQGNFTGVAGCDIRIKDLEPLIMPHLLAVPGDAALINANNRVILGNSGMYLIGDRIKSGVPNQRRMPLDVPTPGTLTALHHVTYTGPSRLTSPRGIKPRCALGLLRGIS